MSTSFLSRLSELPEAFTHTRLQQQFGWSLAQSNVYLARWKEKGLIKSAGPRAGVYFNLLKNPNSPEDRKIEAISHLYPSSTLSGASVLHALGWSTQVPHFLHVATLKQRSFVKMDGVEWKPRSKADYLGWHAWQTQEGRPKETIYGLPSLCPILAIVDAWKYNDQWKPDADDIDLPSEEELCFKSAISFFKVKVPDDWLSAHPWMDEIQLPPKPKNRKFCP